MKLSTGLLLTSCALGTALKVKRDTPAEYEHEFDEELVDNEYIVMLKEGETLETHFDNIGQNLTETAPMFHHLKYINGYYAELDPQTIHEIVRMDPGVDYVQHNRRLPDRDGQEPNSEETGKSESVLQKAKRWMQETIHGVPWNLQMVQRYEKMSIHFRVNGHGYAMKDAGEGVNVYIIDSGIRTTHEAVGGMASNFQGRDTTKYCRSGNTPATDSRGHGTGAAGQVHLHAPGANLINVRVYCSDGSMGLTMIAMTDVLDEHMYYKVHQPAGWRGSIVNMSWGVKWDRAWAQQTSEMFKNGMALVAAAGNDNSNAKTSPCGHPKFTRCIASCDIRYRKSEFSDYGSKVTHVAPGDNLNIANAFGDESYWGRSGTSYATPAVAGIMAIYMGYESITDDPKKVYQRLDENALEGVLEGFSSDTPNKLVQTGIDHPKRRGSDPYYISDYFAGIPIGGGPGGMGLVAAQQDDAEDDDDDGNYTTDPISNPSPPATMTTHIGNVTVDWGTAPTVSEDAIPPAEFTTDVTPESVPWPTKFVTEGPLPTAGNSSDVGMTVTLTSGGITTTATAIPRMRARLLAG